jgi:predicted transcriptional regulator
MLPLKARGRTEVKVMSTQKVTIELDTDLMTKLKTKADAANKTPSEMIAELTRKALKA